MSISQRDIDQLQRAAVASLHEHWKFYLIEGIILVALGAAAVVAPQVATVAVTILLGWVFLISGIIGLFTTFRMRRVPGFWWSLLSAVLAIIVGVMLGVWPLQGAISLTFVLIAFFFVEGSRRSCLLSSINGICPERGGGCLPADLSISSSGV
jgi:uncharacterized membrane protein HdeD (DUF308 family)